MKQAVDFIDLGPLIVLILLYPIGAMLALRITDRANKAVTFAVYNILVAFIASYASLAANHSGYDDEMRIRCLKLLAGFFFMYVVAVIGCHQLLKRLASGRGTAAPAYLVPIALLLLLKLPLLDHVILRDLKYLSQPQATVFFLGISYMSFRLCYLVQEVQNETVPVPSLWEYLAFAFFVPTLSVGPISPYRQFTKSLDSAPKPSASPQLCVTRILVGLVKYLLIGTIAKQFAYQDLMLDGNPHAKLDLLISIFAYTVFMYCNFSGFCDIAIGVSGLIGFEVMENFNQPFSARNLQEFWNRWHISLSTWLRDMLFSPLVKFLGRAWGPKKINHAIAAAICIVFLVCGLWHGFGVHFALWGLAQGIGLATVHYSTVYMKKKLGRDGYVKYRENKFMLRLGQIATTTYFSLTLFLFANTVTDMRAILHTLK